MKKITFEISDEAFYGGTLYLISELEECGLVEQNCESWHITYIVSEFGKKILDKSFIRDQKIDILLY